jgi:hypothetical protein
MQHHLRGLLATTVLALSAQAHAVVEAGHISLNTTPQNGWGLPTNFALSIHHTLNSAAYTGVNFYFASGSLTGRVMTADRGADIYLVQAGDVFSNASITGNPNQTFIFGLNNGGGNGSSIPVGNDFYLGIRPGTFNGTPTTFGWAHFGLDSAGKVQLLGSAMAFGESGIVVGTLQAAVPEPSTVILTGLGLAGLALATRRARKAAAS